MSKTWMADSTRSVTANKAFGSELRQMDKSIVEIFLETPEASPLSLQERGCLKDNKQNFKEF